MSAAASPRAAAAAAAPVLAAAALLLLQLLAPAAGHGMMINPRSRNWAGYLEQNFAWAHGLSMGGVAMVSDGGKLQYPAGKRGFCGDAWNETRWNNPGAIQASYAVGQAVNVDVLVAVNHMGRMSVQLCDLDAKPGKGKCRSLSVKAPGFKDVKSWYLPGIRNWGGGNHGSEGPKYGDGTFSAYKLPEITDGSGWGCVGQRYCNTFKDMWVYRTQWLLPQGFKCDHCKLQWTWTTGHNCWPPCEKGNPMPQCENKQQFGTCGSPGTAYPEEFVNCADIRIADNAKIDMYSQYPPWNGAVQIKGGKWGAVKPSLIHMKDE